MPVRIRQPAERRHATLGADARTHPTGGLPIRGIEVDLMLVDAHLGYCAERSFPERLQADVLEPARRRGSNKFGWQEYRLARSAPFLTVTAVHTT